MSRLHQGTVVAKNGTTLKVEVKRSKRHPLYRKNFTLSKKYQIHDANEQAKAGDEITFADCRPVSKTKRHKLVEVTKEAK